VGLDLDGLPIQFRVLVDDDAHEVASSVTSNSLRSLKRIAFCPMVFLCTASLLYSCST
jgi:hypothetical protein